MTVRFSTDDGQFGLIVTPTSWNKMFRFQLIVDGAVVGDTEPCILGSAMRQLSSLHRLDDPRLARARVDPAGTMSVLCSDDPLYDLSMLNGAESLDRWLVRGYINGESAVVMSQPAEGPESERSIRVAVVPLRDFESVVRSAVGYWVERSSSQPG
jgi:hypothetical protein